MLAAHYLFSVGPVHITNAMAWTVVLSFIAGLLAGLHLERPRYLRGRE